uniref:Uncharacterized protein n=1 Tax=Romanomermis culicivorax TaxID=13658 RepID=A0A915HVT8_ROMCU
MMAFETSGWSRRGKQSHCFPSHPIHLNRLVNSADLCFCSIEHIMSSGDSCGQLLDIRKSLYFFTNSDGAIIGEGAGETRFEKS